MYRIITGGRYLGKDGETQVVCDKQYEASEIDGWCGLAHRVQVKNIETGESTMYFPAEPIKIAKPKKKKKKKKDKHVPSF